MMWYWWAMAISKQNRMGTTKRRREKILHEKKETHKHTYRVCESREQIRSERKIVVDFYFEMVERVDFVSIWCGSTPLNKRFKTSFSLFFRSLFFLLFTLCLSCYRRSKTDKGSIYTFRFVKVYTSLVAFCLSLSLRLSLRPGFGFAFCFLIGSYAFVSLRAIADASWTLHIVVAVIFCHRRRLLSGAIFVSDFFLFTFVAKVPLSICSDRKNNSIGQ